MQLSEKFAAQAALGTVMFCEATRTADGTYETMRLVRQALEYLESRYRHQVAERHRAIEEEGEQRETKPNGAEPPRKRARRKQAAPVQPAMFPPVASPNGDGQAVG